MKVRMLTLYASPERVMEADKTYKVKRKFGRQLIDVGAAVDASDDPADRVGTTEESDVEVETDEEEGGEESEETADEEGEFACEDCHRAFDSPQGLASHSRVHDGE